MNDFTEKSTEQILIASCYSAVQSRFTHIALRDIINVPSGWLDAIFARQIASHILVNHYGIPKRRLATLEGRCVKSMRLAMTTIDNRLQCPVFATSYVSILDEAERLVDCATNAASDAARAA